MKIKNNKNKANSVNFKDNGFPKKIIIASGSIVDIPSLKNVSQIINKGDITRGFFEILEESEVKDVLKEEDSLDKIEKEVKDYTNKEE